MRIPTPVTSVTGCGDPYSLPPLKGEGDREAVAGFFDMATLMRLWLL